MSEEILDSSEREAILRQVISKPKPATSEAKQQPESGSPSHSSDLSKRDFGSLLEESLTLREEFDENENAEMDATRKEVISESRVDLISDVLRSLIK